MIFGPTFAEMRDPGARRPRRAREGARGPLAPARPAEPLEPLVEGRRRGALHRAARGPDRRPRADRRPLGPPLPDGLPQGRPRLLDPRGEAARRRRARPASTRSSSPRPATSGSAAPGSARAWATARCVVLPEEMSAERFEKIRGYGADVVATPGSESNVKEIYDKVRELRARPGEPDPEPVRGVRELPLPLPLHRGGGRGGRGRARASKRAPSSRPWARRGRSRRERDCAGAIPACAWWRWSRCSAPRCYSVGFGAHRIEGIGDKHVTWIHNVWATDLLVCVDDLECLEGLQLLQEGTATLEAEGVHAERARSWVDFFGISGVCNVLGRDPGGRPLRPRPEAGGRHGGDRRLRPLPVGPAAPRRASRGRWTPRRRRRRVEIFRSRRTRLARRGHPRGAPPLAQPEVLHLGGAAGQDRGGAAGPGGPGLVGRPSRSGRTRSTAASGSGGTTRSEALARRALQSRLPSHGPPGGAQAPGGQDPRVQA